MGDERVHFHFQVRAFLGTSQITRSGARSAPASHGRLVVAGSLGTRAVEVAVARDAECCCRVDERVAELMRLKVAYFDGPAHAVPVIGAPALVLRLPEVR